MGSLMPGWAKSSQNEKLRHQTSFTQGEIQAFWNLRNKERESHVKHLEELLQASTEAGRDHQQLQAEVALVNAGSSPFSAEDPEAMSSVEMKARVKDWWTKSNFAYLNEPPEGTWNEVKKGTFTPEFEAHSQTMGSDMFGFAAS